MTAPSTSSSTSWPRRSCGRSRPALTPSRSLPGRRTARRSCSSATGRRARRLLQDRPVAGRRTQRRSGPGPGPADQRRPRQERARLESRRPRHCVPVGRGRRLRPPAAGGDSGDRRPGPDAHRRPRPLDQFLQVLARWGLDLPRVRAPRRHRPRACPARDGRLERLLEGERRVSASMSLGRRAGRRDREHERRAGTLTRWRRVARTG